VSYSAERIANEDGWLSGGEALRQETMTRIITTKFAHWSYEDEVRLFVQLDHAEAKNGLYFADFSDELTLSQIIVGATSDVTRLQIREALSESLAEVPSFKARLAFKAFKIVRNRQETHWN
jgi:hypothetical protein